jgi:hypothetical protein
VIFFWISILTSSLISYIRFFSRHVFPWIRTENSVLNSCESNFHDFKSSWKYNHVCLVVWIWNQRKYEEKLYRTFDLLQYLIKSKHEKLSPILLNQLHHKIWPADSFYNGFEWKLDQSTSNSSISEKTHSDIYTSVLCINLYSFWALAYFILIWWCSNKSKSIWRMFVSKHCSNLPLYRLEA